MANVLDAWAAANTTGNAELITICVPVVQQYLEQLIEEPRFFKFSEPLGVSRIMCLNEASRLEIKFLQKWLSVNQSNSSDPTDSRLLKLENCINQMQLTQVNSTVLAFIYAKLNDLGGSIEMW